MKNFENNLFLDICQNIEVILKLVYETQSDMSDTLCMLGLDNAKIAIKQEFGFAKNEHVSDRPEFATMIAHCVELGKRRMAEDPSLTLKEYVAQLDKIKRSVTRHNAYGSRGYYEFIKNYV